MRRRFGTVASGLTLEPGAIVNETFLKLLKRPTGFENRRHFLAFANKVMLRVLIDYQRARAADKRGGDGIRLTSIATWIGRRRPRLRIGQVWRRLKGFEIRIATTWTTFLTS